MMTTSRSRKEKNSIDVPRGFTSKVLPGIGKPPTSGKSPYWAKYLRLAIAVVRLAEYDYLSKKRSKEFQSAKRFLFGKDTLFTSVCQLLKINQNMARLKLIATKKSGTICDPIFSSISDEYTDTDNLKLSPTTHDIEEVFHGKENKRN